MVRRFLGLACALLAVVQGLFEEQAGTKDWKQENIGNIKRAVYRNHHVYVATDSNVVASMNVRTSEVGWRHVLPEGSCAHPVVGGVSK